MKSNWRVVRLKRSRKGPSLLEKILAEKDRAIARAGKCLLHLRKGKSRLKPEDYDDLHWRLDLLRRTATVWKLHAETTFGFLILPAGRQAPGLRDRVARAIQGLYAEAELSAQDPMIGDPPPASAREIRKATDELRKMLGQLE